MAVERLEHVLDDGVARREKSDGVENGRWPGDEAAHVVEDPGNALALVEELGLGARAHDHLVAARDEELGKGRHDIDVADVRRFEGGLMEEVRSRYGGLLAAIRDGKDLPDDELTQAVSTFKDRFVAETAAGRPGES